MLYLLTTVLRNEWGFRGTVITDCILQLSYINIDRAIAAGNDLILSLMNMQAPSEAVTNSPAGHQVLRTATHNILYASANSIGQEVSVIPVRTGCISRLRLSMLASSHCALFYFRPPPQEC